MEFDKKCRVSLSPNTVLLPVPPSPKVEKRSSKGKPRRRDELLIIEGNDFTEIRFSRFRSASCKNESSRPLELDSGVQLRRGSVYQTSGEVRSIKKLGTEDVRSKIEISRSSDKYFSVRNVDSPCSSSNGNPLNKNQINTKGEPCSSDDFDRNKSVMSSVVKLSMQREHVRDPISREHVARPPLDAKCPLEKDRRCSLHKSVSAKVAMQQSPRQSSGESPRASPKSRFSPIRKIMDPFMKSKSQKSPSGFDVGFGEARRSENINTSKGITRESLLPDISVSDKGPLSLDTGSNFIEKDCCHLSKACSLTHLHGCLKLKKINDVSVFEFSLKSPEEIFVAKTWKTMNVGSWAYTLHSNSNSKQCNASARGSKVCDTTDATIVGQMQASSYLHSEYGDSDAGDTLTSEFVLYDIAHANKCSPSQETSLSLPDTFRLSKGSMDSSVEENINSDNSAAHEKLMSTSEHATDSSFIDSISYPWAPAYLHPNLEVAAIVIQVPFEKRENLKHGIADKIKEITGHSEGKRGTQVRSTISYPKINVVASTGNHSLPEAECQGPSPLLSRWRSGGGCECGGWDMTCPLIVFNNEADNRKSTHLPLATKNFPTQLFVQGVKEDMPAFSMTTIEEGHYSVNFHARLSSLQAFSISIAMLHSSETSPVTKNNRKIPNPQSNTLKTFLEDEVKFLIESVTDMSKKHSVASPPTKDSKTKVSSSRKETSSFAFNPPFSPISRA